MKIDGFILGDFETNCYVVRAEESATDCLVIDIGFNPDELVGALAEKKQNPVAVVLTHGHADHIVGLDHVRQRFPRIKVYIHELDAPMLGDANANLSAFVEGAYTAEPADVLLRDGDIVEEAGIRLEVLHTPGHTPGGICLYARQEGLVFVGDTLFADSVGRTDFPGGDMGQLIRSIKNKLLSLPDSTVAYPGHGSRTTIGRERRANPFLI
jgi:glyoxylase-like metal-dependent hydrolase (beta-lactamase superfamily II)